MLIPEKADGDNRMSSKIEARDLTSTLVLVPTQQIRTLVTKVWQGAPVTLATTPAAAPRPVGNTGVAAVVLALARETDVTPWQPVIGAWQRAGAVVRLARGDWLAWSASTDFEVSLAAIAEALDAATRIDPATIPAAPDMSIVQRVTLPAPPLELSAFGPPLAEWIASAAASKSAPADYVAFSLMVAAAGAVGASRWVSPWSGWSEPCLLWVMLPGVPSAAKSPAMDATRQPLAEVERDLSATWPELQKRHEQDAMTATAARDEWERAVRAATKAGDPAPPIPSGAIAPHDPQMPRMVITDVTIESAARILHGNPRGLILWRDECAAWLGNLGKYGDGDRAFWLESNGARPYTVDRQKLAEPLFIRHHAISILGGIQPDRLATLLLDGDDDGLASRFLFAWPDPVPPRRPRGAPNTAVVTRMLCRLRGLDFGRDAKGEPCPVTLIVEPSAVAPFQSWREEHHAASQSQSGLMASAYGKMPGQVLRIALALELMWWAAGPDGVPEPKQVSADALGSALDLIETYAKPMLARVSGDAALPVADRNAATLAREIQRRRVDKINATHVRRKWKLPGMREASAVMAAIGVLIEAGWLREAGLRDGDTKGRQRADYAVDPAVHGDGA